MVFASLDGFVIGPTTASSGFVIIWSEHAILELALSCVHGSWIRFESLFGEVFGAWGLLSVKECHHVLN